MTFRILAQHLLDLSTLFDIRNSGHTDNSVYLGKIRKIQTQNGKGRYDGM